MKPIDQLLHHDPGKKVWGDCFRACVASLLELPAEDVPHFCDQNNSRWLLDLEAFLTPRGLAPLSVQAKGCPALDDVYSIASGPSPRFPDVLHSVVAKGCEVVHDPHRDRQGLGEIREFMFFIAVNPARSAAPAGASDSEVGA